MPRHLSESRWNLSTVLLSPLSLLYGAVWAAYASIYRFGLKKPQEPHVPVVTIGNLTVGGSGKTPMTLYVGRMLSEMGYEVVISASGYGSPAQHGASLAPEGQLNAGRWGDEPAMIRMLWQDPPLIVGRDRVRAAEICAARHPGAVLLMDDGFQHLRLRQHITIVLDDTNAPNRLLLPAGPYREPLSGLDRANLVLPRDYEIVSSGVWFETPQSEPADTRESQEVDTLTAIGSPARFVKEVEETGVRVKNRKILRDHDPLTRGTLLDGLGLERPLVTTAKDWVKLRERADLAGRTIWIARHEVRVRPEADFRDWLDASIRSHLS